MRARKADIAKVYLSLTIHTQKLGSPLLSFPRATQPHFSPLCPTHYFCLPPRHTPRTRSSFITIVLRTPLIYHGGSRRQPHSILGAHGRDGGYLFVNLLKWSVSSPLREKKPINALCLRHIHYQLPHKFLSISFR